MIFEVRNGPIGEPSLGSLIGENGALEEENQNLEDAITDLVQ